METITTPTTTELAVLGLLAEGERSGYDLDRAARRSIGTIWTPSRSQIYKVLPRLVAAGLASSREVEQRSRPDKALYSLTAPGRAALVAWIERVEPTEEQDSRVFLLKLLFGWAAPPAAALVQLDAYRAYLERRVATWEAQLRDLPADEPVHSRVALLHGLAGARATLTWADDARAILEGA